MTAPPSELARPAAWLGGALVALAGLACGGPAFERLPRPAADLSGHWIYVAEASDDAAAIIAAALPKPRRPGSMDRQSSGLPSDDGTGRSGGQQGGRGGGQSRRGGRGGDSSSGNPGAAPATPPAWGRISPGEFVRAFVFPATRLDVSSQPELLTVAQGDRRRRFQPGDEEPLSVNDRYGSRTIRAGWDGTVFNVRSTGATRLSVLETFRPLPGDRLGTLVELTTPGMKTVKVRSVYRRATEVELAAPPPEGPPLPGPR